MDSPSTASYELAPAIDIKVAVNVVDSLADAGSGASVLYIRPKRIHQIFSLSYVRFGPYILKSQCLI